MRTANVCPCMHACCQCAQIAAIAEIMFSQYFWSIRTLASVVAGVVHAFTPTIHRIILHTPDSDDYNATCKAPPHLPW
jgi:hypothetical protein